jgi:flagellar motor protein MotB
MPKQILAAVALAFSAAAAVGCAQPHLQARVDQLTREQEDLLRQKAQLEADLLATRARADAAGRFRPPAPEPEAAPRERLAPRELPGDLDGKVDIRRRGDETVIDLPNDVFFASGSATLSREGDRTMGAVLDYIRRHHAEGRIRVEGHSDSDPIRRTKSKYHCNWELSFERAHAVAHYLVDKGRLEPARLVCEAHGEHHPAEPGNKAKNRRVEIVLSR